MVAFGCYIFGVTMRGVLVDEARILGNRGFSLVECNFFTHELYIQLFFAPLNIINFDLISQTLPKLSYFIIFIPHLKIKSY